jgi:hypothetical protein
MSTKTCQVCLHPQPESAETCSECGESSWPPAVARSAPPPPAAAHAATPPDRSAVEEHWPTDKEYKHGPSSVVPARKSTR